MSTQAQTCALCFGYGTRTYYPMTKTWGQVIRTRKCGRCGGSGIVDIDHKNPAPRRKAKA